MFLPYSNKLKPKPKKSTKNQCHVVVERGGFEPTEDRSRQIYSLFHLTTLVSFHVQPAISRPRLEINYEQQCAQGRTRTSDLQCSPTELLAQSRLLPGSEQHPPAYVKTDFLPPHVANFLNQGCLRSLVLRAFDDPDGTTPPSSGHFRSSLVFELQTVHFVY